MQVLQRLMVSISVARRKTILSLGRFLLVLHDGPTHSERRANLFAIVPVTRLRCEQKCGGESDPAYTTTMATDQTPDEAAGGVNLGEPGCQGVRQAEGRRCVVQGAMSGLAEHQAEQDALRGIRDGGLADRHVAGTCGLNAHGSPEAPRHPRTSASLDAVYATNAPRHLAVNQKFKRKLPTSFHVTTNEDSDLEDVTDTEKVEGCTMEGCRGDVASRFVECTTPMCKSCSRTCVGCGATLCWAHWSPTDHECKTIQWPKIVREDVKEDWITKAFSARRMVMDAVTWGQPSKLVNALKLLHNLPCSPELLKLTGAAK